LTTFNIYNFNLYSYINDHILIIILKKNLYFLIYIYIYILYYIIFKIDVYACLVLSDECIDLDE